MRIGQQVTFNQGDENNTQLTGTISRVWRHGDVTIKVPGAIAGTVRTFVRKAAEVQVQA
jgi:hypothetical protein